MIEQNGHPQTSDQILRGGLNNSYHFVLYSNRQTPDLENKTFEINKELLLCRLS
jgi:hypothetical protein